MSGFVPDAEVFRSIIWSARPKTLSGKVFPSEAAVLRFRANSKVTGCSMGSSAGSAPLNILSA